LPSYFRPLLVALADTALPMGQTDDCGTALTLASEEFSPRSPA
jgi:hypothetical protein